MADIIDKISCEIMILVGDTYQIESITFGNWFSMAKYFVPAYAWNELEKPYRTEDEHLLEFWRKVRNLDDDLTEYIVKCCNNFIKINYDDKYKHIIHFLIIIKALLEEGYEYDFDFVEYLTNDKVKIFS